MARPLQTRSTPAPVIRCDAGTARRLGARIVTGAADLRRLGPACIHILADDGTRWLWPIEGDFLSAILRF